MRTRPQDGKWKDRSLALISLLISGSELFTFFVVIFLVQFCGYKVGQDVVHPSGGQRILAGAWLLDGLDSLVFALVGMAFNRRGGTGIIALLSSLLVSSLCGTQMVV